jgi:hypothetical protein
MWHVLGNKTRHFLKLVPPNGLLFCASVHVSQRDVSYRKLLSFLRLLFARDAVYVTYLQVQWQKDVFTREAPPS